MMALFQKGSDLLCSDWNLYEDCLFYLNRCTTLEEKLTRDRHQVDYIQINANLRRSNSHRSQGDRLSQPVPIHQKSIGPSFPTSVPDFR